MNSLYPIIIRLESIDYILVSNPTGSIEDTSSELNILMNQSLFSKLIIYFC